MPLNCYENNFKGSIMLHGTESESERESGKENTENKANEWQ